MLTDNQTCAVKVLALHLKCLLSDSDYEENDCCSHHYLRLWKSCANSGWKRRGTVLPNSLSSCPSTSSSDSNDEGELEFAGGAVVVVVVGGCVLVVVGDELKTDGDSWTSGSGCRVVACVATGSGMCCGTDW